MVNIKKTIFKVGIKTLKACLKVQFYTILEGIKNICILFFFKYETKSFI